MGDTAISWTDKSWNPIRGCSRVSEGCRNCYAEVQAARIVRCAKGKQSAYDGLVKVRSVRQYQLDAGGEPTGNFRTVEEPRWTGEVRFVPELLAEPLKWRKPQRVFVNSMSDLFHEKLTNEEIAAVFGVMAACPQHTFQVLTKRPQRMREWFEWAKREGDGYDFGRFGPSGLLTCAWEIAAGEFLVESEGDLHFPDLPSQEKFGCSWPLSNVWLGVSVENQAAADERIPELLQTPAAVRFLSCEPLLGPVFLAAKSRLDWVIAGCESGRNARPCDVNWLRSLREQCKEAGAPFWLKQARQESSICRTCGSRDSYYDSNPNRLPPLLNADGSPYRCMLGAVQTGEPGVVRCGSCESLEVDEFPVSEGPGSTRNRGVIELPYLDGVQHAAMPEVSRGRTNR